MRICLSCDGISDVEQPQLCAHCGVPMVAASEVHFPLRRNEAEAGHPLIGAVVGGKYRLTGVLGKGGMGTVFRAMHEVSLVPVAIKLLHRRFADRAEYREWFLSEARKAGRVSHEHSARIQDVGETDSGDVYLVMELAAGPPLSAWLGPGVVSLRPGVVAEIVEQIARALEAAHAVGVVHRDLSPRNIAVSVRDGAPFVKVLDFGIAKAAPEYVAELGEAPTGYASPAYAAPEHLEGGEVDGRADLYSLGVIAYQLLTGRLPVNGRTRNEVIRASVDGQVEPLRVVSGVPRRLVRLVNAMLARDPADRPASAAAVRAEIRRIVRPGEARGLWAAAAAVMLVAAMLVFVAFRDPPARFLVAHAGAELALETQASGIPARELPRSALETWRFEYGGFDPSELEVEWSRGDRTLGRTSLSPRIEDGFLILHPADPAWIGALDAIETASRRGAVVLSFHLRERRPLGYARLLVDSEAPLLRWTELPDGVEVGRTAVFWNGASTFVAELEDTGSIVDVAVVLRCGGARHRRSVAVDAQSREARTIRLNLASMFGALLPGVADRGPSALVLEAVDAAGNAGESATLNAQHLDLRTPAIVSVPRIIPFDQSGARVRVRLDAEEDGVTISVRGPDGVLLKTRNAQPVGDRLDLVLELPEGGAPFETGRYRLRSEDRWRNQSAEFQEDWVFERREPNVELLPGSGAIAALGDGVFLAGGGQLQFELRCNTLYRPVSATLRAGDTTPMVSTSQVVAQPQPGHWRLVLEELDAGVAARVVDATLSIDLEPIGGLEGVEGVAVGPFQVLLRPARMRVRLPSLDGVRFHAEVVDQAVLRAPAAGAEGTTLTPGAAWGWPAVDPRAVRGRVWYGSSTDALQSRVLAGPITAPLADRLLRGVPLRRGRNVVALELEDVLGRAVEVRLGDRVAPVLGGAGPAAAAAQALDFYFDPEPCSPLQPSIGAEFGEPVRFTVRCALPPLRASDEVQLQVGERTLRPRARRPSPSPGGQLFDFVAEFEDVAAAGGLGSLSAAEFAAGGPYRVPARIGVGPAGEYPMVLVVLPIRSTLTPLVIGDVTAQGSDELLRIRMTPSLGVSTHRDPVGGGVGGRATWRALPETDVRSVGDVYLQESELTRAQYDAGVRRGLAWVEARGAARVASRLVHAADPLGVERLTEQAMVPVGLRSRPDEWGELLRAGPERPVTGVGFFQAWTVARLIGAACFDDPMVFRLPMGAELEVAAYSGERANPTAVALGLHAADSVDARRFGLQAAAARAGDGSSWPLNREELVSWGDVIRTELGFELVGLDFGVEEWVGDLPYTPGATQGALLREWLADHVRHLQRVEDFADAERGGDFPADLAAQFARLGVVRGGATARPGVLVDGRTGRSVFPSDPLARSVPGVVRCRNIQRSGLEPSSLTVDSSLMHVGMRLAGGVEFLRWVRSR